ncbi:MULTISPECIES: putative bifunctional diguanylate cyclase/phosphodiesterase [unclassified Arsukibacterium]|uniref:putative bifunctional diguanylate cyclase/phosphodiesterase n=1 Tax=unclassified Arsukibacterium TaxID=2635278 RepID=UPI000C397953|nr:MULTISPECIES: GGDEF domain-containing phosphodiesterase [unclassified Arsukibacterium]MBM33713.1 GGDEF-domain containing protein [Rheinheimera sp.]|tara:strand:- start:35714 stop:37618 length:1905 start_codon:yes stop_codon:yes gene_type:complete
MPNNSEHSQKSAINYPNQSQKLRTNRLLQIIGLTLFSLVLAVAVADGTTKWVLVAGCFTLALAGIFAYQRHVTAATVVLLWAMCLMLSALAFISGGIRDLALMGYPGVLVFAAMLGNSRLFFSLIAFMLAFCASLTYLAVSGIVSPVIPTISAAHFVFVAAILLVTGVSVYLLYRDQQRLMTSLHAENHRVKQSQAHIEHLALHDPLTALPNRISCQQHFQQLYSQCLSNSQQLAVLFLDLDNFKPVNDSLGHAAGDLLLQQLARRLENLLSEHDILCRFGGDEFLLLVPGFSSNEALAATAEALLQQTTSPFYIMQNMIEISGSVGIAVAPQDGIEFSEICKHADMAMFQAKADGRNIYRFYHDALNKASIDKFNMLQLMRKALKNSEFQLYFQPKIRLSDQQIIGAEALLRWPQADGSMITPDEFIPLAESSGLIVEIGEWVLQQACLACSRWHQQGYSNLTIAVNLSYVQFRDGKLEQQVQQALSAAALPAHALEMELTESLLIGEGDNIARQLAALHQLGLRFSIDDFGTGYSNLGYLRRFNASRLKIDKSFILSLCLSERDEPLVRAIIQMSKSLGLKTVAEGIENSATAAQLALLGCDEGQGFYWARPLPESDFLGYVSAEIMNETRK